MSNSDIQAFQPSDGALSAEHYQTFELAKENDSVLGGDNIAQIRSYAAYARAQAQAIHKTIAATSGIEDVAAIKSEATETAQTFAKVSIYADQRIGEILRELPTRQGKRTDTLVTDVTEVTKRQAEANAGISHKQAIDLQAMASNPDVVQAVLDKAEAEGRIPSRNQVIDAINEKNQAERDRRMAEKERDNANDALADAYRANELMEAQVASLQRQIAEGPKQEVVERVVEREVVPSDYEATKRKVDSLRHDNDVYIDTNRKLRKQLEDARKKLEHANVLIGEKQRNDSAEWDIAALTTATNNYLRQYGGKAWAFDQFYRVDETTQTEFVKAINNLAAFAQNLAQMIKENTNE